MTKTKQIARFFGRRQKPSDWKIIVNKKKEIPCNKEILISYSSSIKKYLEDNASSTSYEIEMESNPSDLALKNVSNYLKGDTFFINLADISFYGEISHKLNLENLEQYLQTVTSNIQYTCNYTINNYEKENEFLVKFEILEQELFQLKSNTEKYQSVLSLFLEFITKQDSIQKRPDNNSKKKNKYLAKLLFNYCTTRIQQSELNLAFKLISELQTNIKEYLIEIISNLNGLSMSEQHFVRLLYENEIITKEEINELIYKTKPEELKEGQMVKINSNFIFLLDFYITALTANQTKFSGKSTYNHIGNNDKKYPLISCEMNPIEKVGTFSLSAADTKLGDFLLSDLMKNDWKLHKKLGKEGVNENEIAALIRTDDLDGFLSFISKNADFNLNGEIPFSIYERHDILNGCNYVQYAAFYSSLKIFKYLLTQKVDLTNAIYNFAFAGGDFEIIHLCDELVQIETKKDSSQSFRLPFVLNATRVIPYETAIKYHHHEILQWIYETKKVAHSGIKIIDQDSPVLNIDNNSALTRNCISCCNFISLHYLLSQELYFPEIVCQAIQADLYELTKFTLNYKFMADSDLVLNGNALYYSVLSNDIEYLKLFGSNQEMLSHQKEYYYGLAFKKICEQDNIEMTEYFMTHFPNIEINQDKPSNTNPLYIVCNKGSAKILELLLKYHFDELNFNYVNTCSRIINEFLF